jgi:hypothetical protein
LPGHGQGRGPRPAGVGGPGDSLDPTLAAAGVRRAVGGAPPDRLAAAWGTAVLSAAVPGPAALLPGWADSLGEGISNRGFGRALIVLCRC